MREIVVSIDKQVTVADFVSKFNDDNALTGGAPLTVKDFLDYKGDTLITNKEIILSSYTPSEKKSWVSGGAPTTMKVGITVRVPLNKSMVEKQMLYGKNQFVQQTGFNAYFNEYQRILQSSDNYYKAETMVSKFERVVIDSQIINLNVRVWVYSKVLDELIDISPLISSCSTSKNMGAGSFSMVLNPTRALTFDVEYLTGVNQKGVVNYFNLLDNDNKPVQDYFEKYIQYNDLVFIRFERLETERDEIGYESGQVLKLSSLANPTKEPERNPAWYRVWDMIGLVDSVNSNTSFMSGDKSVFLNGRDLTKLLVDDGSYFYSYKFVSGGDNKFQWMGDENSDVFKRNILTGAFDQYMFNFSLKSMKEYLGFIVNRLSNIGIIPNSVFSSYGERLSKLDKIEGLKEEDKVRNGVWSIIKFFFDENLADRLLSGALGNADGTILDLFNRVCQQPFVEVIGDTWIDTFNFTVRQPPFTKKAIESVIDNDNNYITIETKDLLSTSLSYDTTAYAWYQVTPADGMVGEDGKVTAARIPVIFLPQIANVFGNKRLQVSDIYLYTGALKGTAQTGNLGIVASNTLNDLLYLIESFVYLPFTRRGTIVMNGDRRVKVGTFVRLDATDELYYVTGVNNNLILSSSIDRTTTIEVMRGMRWDLIKGVNYEMLNTARKPYSNKVDLGLDLPKTETPKQRVVSSGRYSYFNIVDIDGLRNSIVKSFREGVTLDFSKMVKTDFTVNDDVFEYMIKRRYL